jgi:hypothetical protein
MSPRASEIPHFAREFLGAEETFTRIGEGDLGGKAVGLDLVRREVLSRLDPAAYPGIRAAVPTLTVLATDIFDSFMERNDLYTIAMSDDSDDRIAHAFQQAELPAEHVGDLRALITSVHEPLAVRSSSLLEDALAHPFAGVYRTKMIPNNQADIDTRFHRLVEAIKFVYASTFFRETKRYIRSVGQSLESEKMGVVIQEIVGARWDDRFYPAVSGVIRSYSYYPTGHAEPEDGVVTLALGLGKHIVDGGLAWTYSPAYPKAPPPYKNMGDLLKNSQKEFWAVNMGPPPPHDPIRETEYLVRPDITTAEKDGAIEFLVSTYDPRSERLRPGVHGAGAKVLDFAPILKSAALPLNELLARLMELTKDALGCDVEMEFAVGMDPLERSEARFGFLQARPMMVARDEITVSDEEMRGDAVVVSSDSVLGNGTRDDIFDVVYLKPDAFDTKHTNIIAAELEGLNHKLVKDGRPYLLMGFGRWGSTDPWLGVPVEWGQISGARVIVEATLPEVNPDLSQGSHFFLNLISFQVLYMSVKHTGDYGIRWDWIEKQPAEDETRFVRHVRLAAPLGVKVDGRTGRGVIEHAG